MRLTAMIAMLFAMPVLTAAAQEGRDENGWSELRAVEVSSTTLHYMKRGDGSPIIFVHGGLADFREWMPVAEALGGFKTLVYSRRYNWPNEGAPERPDYSARVDASDLAAFIETLELGPAHIVGVSYGGYAAMVLALERPDLVRTLTVAEPALAGWLPQIEGGADIHEDFMTRMWLPSGEAARDGDTEGSIRIALDYFAFPDAWNQFPPEVRSEILRNGREWKMLTTSEDGFPDKDPQAAENLQAPVLMISGSDSMALSKMIDAELEMRLPTAARVIIPGATHQMCSEQPDACAAAIQSFLDGDE